MTESPNPLLIGCIALMIFGILLFVIGFITESYQKGKKRKEEEEKKKKQKEIDDANMIEKSYKAIKLSSIPCETIITASNFQQTHYYDHNILPFHSGLYKIRKTVIDIDYYANNTYYMMKYDWVTRKWFNPEYSILAATVGVQAPRDLTPEESWCGRLGY